ncbi:MAG: hypothetical protein JWR32_5000 [Mycobacterium sp.]|nr:hypothetical protein [Mycobacterium sp.]
MTHIITQRSASRQRRHTVRRLHLVQDWPDGAPDVPLPDGVAVVDEWQEPSTSRAYRCILGTSRTIRAEALSRWQQDGGQEVVVRNHVTQFSDGSFDLTGRIERPGVTVTIDSDLGITSDDARRLAAVLIEAADELDRWAGRPLTGEA